MLGHLQPALQTSARVTPLHFDIVHLGARRPTRTLFLEAGDKDLRNDRNNYYVHHRSTAYTPACDLPYGAGRITIHATQPTLLRSVHLVREPP